MYSIAIDGPSGSGKSTLAKSLSKELGYLYIDTGAMYRTIGLFAYRNGIDPSDGEEMSKHFDEIDIDIEWKDGAQHMFLCGEDVTDFIRTPEISMYASAVSAIPSVREFLLDKQRDFAKHHNVIMDGRDIGTVILPNADVKIFLRAGHADRAKRRYEELIARGEDVTYEKVLRDMEQRDHNDSTRALAPCVPAADAVILDNTGFEPEETLGKALEIIDGKIGILQEKK